MSLISLLILLLVLSLIVPVFNVPWGYSGSAWPVGPVLAVILLVVILTRVL